MSVPPSSPLHAATFSRRSLLTAALAGTALLAAGCTGSSGDAADAVTPAQVDQLAAAVAVQEQLVSAYDRALTADPALAGTATVLADQARTQLERLRAAAPGAAASTAPGSSAAPDPAGVRGWLRAQVSTAAAAHAAAAPEFTGGRAALLGSIAAGLRGQEALLA